MAADHIGCRSSSGVNAAEFAPKIERIDVPMTNPYDPPRNEEMPKRPSGGSAAVVVIIVVWVVFLVLIKALPPF